MEIIHLIQISFHSELLMKTNLNDGYWMGANDIQNEDTWVWVDGTEGINISVMYYLSLKEKNHLSSIYVIKWEDSKIA